MKRLAILSLICVALAAQGAGAHEQQFPIGGKLLKIDTRGTPDKHRLLFKSVRDPLINPLHDPAAESSALLVRWTGASGAGAGRTALITLDPAYWKPLGNPPGSTGYKYVDRSGSAGGITTVLYKRTSNGGLLKVVGKGAGLDWELDGPNDSVWVHFKVADEWHCAELGSGGLVVHDEAGRFLAKDASAPSACPAQVCGNGIVELGEECDDGNVDDGDACSNLCEAADCAAEYDSTWEALQTVLLDGYGCAATFCHSGAFPAGSLDLTPASAYAGLVNAASTISPLDRIEPGDEALSFLYNKLAAKTFDPNGPPIQGSPMPANGLTVTEAHLEALRLFIRAGAPETGVVEGTADLLDTCLPPPDPNKIPPLDPPAASEGFQVWAPPWPLPSQSESEICYAVYYDLDQLPGTIPASAQEPCPDSMGGASQTCVAWNKTVLAQDPQSHHSIIRLYLGTYDVLHPGWGAWTCKGGANSGLACDPRFLTTPAPAGADCGPGSGCSGAVVPSVACLGYGPPDFGFSVSGSGTATSPNIGGSQVPLHINQFPPTVRSVLPKKGVVVFNSHAFNLTDTDSTMEQYFNVHYADTSVAVNQAQAIFDSDSIFAMLVPPFQTQEICRTYTVPSGGKLFELSSHMHKRGVLFRIWAPPNASCTPGPTCTPNAGAPIYISTEYNDPVQLRFDPAIDFTGLTAQNRRYKYCAKYDNGATDIQQVKRRSTSPPALVGGPCAVSETRCIGGPQHNQLCNGSNAFCDSSAGAGDGDCDACPLRGGVTTEDEMFILLGGYY